MSSRKNAIAPQTISGMSGITGLTTSWLFTAFGEVLSTASIG